MNNQQRKIDIFIEGLMPTPEEYADNSRFMHLCEYACQLDEAMIINYQSEDQLGLIEHLNKMLDKYPPTAPEYEAVEDLALTLESQFNEFKGVFVYE